MKDLIYQVVFRNAQGRIVCSTIMRAKDINEVKKYAENELKNDYPALPQKNSYVISDSLELKCISDYMKRACKVKRTI